MPNNFLNTAYSDYKKKKDKQENLEGSKAIKMYYIGRNKDKNHRQFLI